MDVSDIPEVDLDDCLSFMSPRLTVMDIPLKFHRTEEMLPPCTREYDEEDHSLDVSSDCLVIWPNGDIGIALLERDSRFSPEWKGTVWRGIGEDGCFNVFHDAGPVWWASLEGLEDAKEAVRKCPRSSAIRTSDSA